MSWRLVNRRERCHICGELSIGDFWIYWIPPTTYKWPVCTGCADKLEGGKDD